MAYPSFVNAGSVAAVGSGTSLTLNLPASIIAGRYLFGFTTIALSSSPVWPAGWTVPPGGQGFWAYHVATGSDTAPTVTWTGSGGNLGWIGQWDGVGGIGAIVDNQATSGTLATNAGITTTANASLALAIVVSRNGSSAPTLPTGFTSEATGTNGATFTGSFRLAEEQIATSGTATGSVSSNIGGSLPWRFAMIELKSVVAASVLQRRTLSQIGTRIGSRQRFQG